MIVCAFRSQDDILDIGYQAVLSFVDQMQNTNRLLFHLYERLPGVSKLTMSLSGKTN